MVVKAVVAQPAQCVVNRGAGSKRPRVSAFSDTGLLRGVQLVVWVRVTEMKRMKLVKQLKTCVLRNSSLIIIIVVYES